jgi:hypothetical protein
MRGRVSEAGAALAGASAHHDSLTGYLSAVDAVCTRADEIMVHLRRSINEGVA